MIIENFKDFPHAGRLIGIDPGARRVGIAVSDVSREYTFTRPQIMVSGMSGAIDEIIKIISDDNIKGIVIGLPLRMDGTESDTTKMVRDFANDLADKTDVPIVFIDETLTSSAASEITKDKKELDSIAAKIILENSIAMIQRAKK
ncbi:MAG: Holliday junction resolvase RuvX [Rickettsiales bacterium]|nr:Holliday junction resolvase RuvX [Rickettsiales bacterium]